jgi:hypothetical protein
VIEQAVKLHGVALSSRSVTNQVNQSSDGVTPVP